MHLDLLLKFSFAIIIFEILWGLFLLDETRAFPVTLDVPCARLSANPTTFSLVFQAFVGPGGLSLVGSETLWNLDVCCMFNGSFPFLCKRVHMSMDASCM